MNKSPLSLGTCQECSGKLSAGALRGQGDCHIHPDPLPILRRWCRLMSLVKNERTKLIAALFNALAVAVVAAGLFAPAAAMVYGISSLKLGAVYFATVILVCVGAGALLHWIGLSILRRLQE